MLLSGRNFTKYYGVIGVNEHEKKNTLLPAGILYGAFFGAVRYRMLDQDRFAGFVVDRKCSVLV